MVKRNGIGIKLRIILFATFCLVLSLAVRAIRLFNAYNLAAALAKLDASETSLRNQADADQMHDALRADILAAALASSDPSGGQRQTIEKQLQQHVAMLERSFQSN